jgi:hypothetical protein
MDDKELFKMEQKPEMKIAKYLFTLEAWFWSVLLIPIIVLHKVLNFILQIFNIGCILSLIRIGWIPITLYTGYKIAIAPHIDHFLLWMILIISIVCGLLISLFTLQERCDDTKYIGHKMWWK